MPLSPRTLRPANTFTPRSISGLALWLDAADSSSLYTTDAGPVTAVSSPTEISGCALWLDGADEKSMFDATSGGSNVPYGNVVARWEDKSGNGRHFTATGTARPTLTPSGLNGRSVVTFDGTATQMLATGGFLQVANATILAVFKYNSGQYGGIISSCDNANDVSPRLVIHNGLFRQWGYGNFSDVTQETSPTLISGVVASGASSIYRSGALGDSDVVSGTLTTGNNQTAIGTYRTNTGNHLNGYIAEVVVFLSALSTTDRARIERYLAAKWGISGVHAPATATNDPVGAWLDKSGNARHATQSTAASRPTISADKQGGKKALAFASQSQTVVSPATVAQYVADATTSPKMFFAWVARPEGGAASVVFGSPTHPNNASRVFYASDFGLAGNHIVDFGSVSTARLTGTVGNEANNVGHVYSAFRDGAVMSVRRDGVEILRKTDTTGGYTDTTGTLSINTTGGGSATSSWMEFMAYAASMPAANIARLERYLAARWGITLAPQVSNPDAQDWINRVYANGSTVLATTAAAVNTFCDAINNAGIRDRFYRLNLFCGGAGSSDPTRLNAALVPLYRGPSVSNTFGSVTDTNAGGVFVAGDYTETGATGGLTGGGTRYLDTGFPMNTLPSTTSGHAAVYCPNRSSRVSFAGMIGVNVLAAGGFGISTDTSVYGIWGQLAFATNTTNGLLLASRTTDSSQTTYVNGASIATNTTPTTPTASALNVPVFANRASVSVVDNHDSRRYCFYSIGLGLTQPQVTELTNAVQAFQTALQRNV